MQKSFTSLIMLIIIIFSILLVCKPTVSSGQKLTTRVPHGMGLLENGEYVFKINGEYRRIFAVSLVSDSICISPFIVRSSSKQFRDAVILHQLAHFYNFETNGELVKSDSADQDSLPKYKLDKTFWFTTPDLSKITYKGKDGSSFKKAAVIKNARSLKEGIAAEYAFIEKILGKRGVNWKPLGQYFFGSGSKFYDFIEVNITESNEKKYYLFEISDFFGKT